jgi:threonine 3-dehydrogenase
MKTEMHTLAKVHATEGLTLTTAPIPTYKENEVLIKIKKTALCGTDLHIYKWDAWAQKTVPIPMTTGHEFVGEIAAIGNQVQGLKVGDRVSGEGHLTCGYCRRCRAGNMHLCRHVQGIGYDCPGCFAEYFVLPAFNVFKIPDSISDDLASIFDPFGNATHTALSFNLIGEDVLITGAGPLGIMATAICKHVGARYVVITDVNDYRLNLAKKMGADIALNVKDCKDLESTVALLQQSMKTLGMTEGFDVGLEMSGFQTAISSMLTTMNYGGHIALLGISPNEIKVNWDQIIFKGLILKGVYGREMFETWYKMVTMLQSGLNINSVITHHFPYTEFDQAFTLMKSGQCGKVILNWS